MARNIKKLPKWAIKQAGGINKKAWALARRGRPSSRKAPAKKPKKRGSTAKASNPRKPMGIVGKLNAGLRGLRFGLPAIGAAMTEGLNEKTPEVLLSRYSGYNMNSQEFLIDDVKTSAGFYAGNVIEAKAMSMMKIPQMAGKKKLLSVAANFLPEIMTIPHAVAGNWGEAVNELGRRSIGYQPTDHQSFIENDTVRNQWLSALGARLGLGLFSRFAGSMINKHLPKGVNI